MKQYCRTKTIPTPHTLILMHQHIKNVPAKLKNILLLKTFLKILTPEENKIKSPQDKDSIWLTLEFVHAPFWASTFYFFLNSKASLGDLYAGEQWVVAALPGLTPNPVFKTNRRPSSILVVFSL